MPKRAENNNFSSQAQATSWSSKFHTLVCINLRKKFFIYFHSTENSTFCKCKDLFPNSYNLEEKLKFGLLWDYCSFGNFECLCSYLSRGYTCNFLLALTTRHPQSCSAEVEGGGCTCNQVFQTSVTCCKRFM